MVSACSSASCCSLEYIPALRTSADQAGQRAQGRRRRSSFPAQPDARHDCGPSCVLFSCDIMSGLFVRTFESLSNKPLGFLAENLLLLDVVTQQGQPPVVWDQIADNLRIVPGVQSVAIAGWPLLSGVAWNNFVSVGGGTASPIVTYLLAISPGWSETMKIPLLEGRDFRPGDTTPGQAIVNQSFVKTFFEGKNPIGRTFQERENHYQVVGLVANAPYGNLRDGIVPVAYIPFHEVNAQGVAQPETRRRFSSALLAPIHSRSLLFCARQFRKHVRASASAISAPRTNWSEPNRPRTPPGDAGSILLLRGALAGGDWSIRSAWLFVAAAGARIWDSYRSRCSNRRHRLAGYVADLPDGDDGSVIGAALGIASVRYVETCCMA